MTAAIVGSSVPVILAKKKYYSTLGMGRVSFKSYGKGWLKIAIYALAPIIYYYYNSHFLSQLAKNPSKF